MKKRKVFYIDGGAGRVIAAIPALKKYAKLHPSDDWGVVIAGWDNLLWGIPELQERTYSTDTKGLFKNFLIDADIETPEPYRVNGYFQQKLSLAEAFDFEINRTDDHSDLGIPQMILSKAEEKQASNVVADVKQQQGKNITLVIQPFGRSARLDRTDIIDDSSRSLEPQAYLSLAKKLSTKYNLIFFGEQQLFMQADTYTFKLQTDLRGWAAIVECADYFVGVDSVGQHMARAFNKPGTVVVGSTFPINTTYPDYFQLYEKRGIEKVYSPIRISGLDGHLADRLNDRCMDFDEKEVDELFMKIVGDIEKKVKVK
jgi:ADP-heptose:LPS heptosyltransferase